MRIYYNKVDIFTVPCNSEEGGSENMFVNNTISPVISKIAYLQEDESSFKRYQQYYEWLRDKISDDKVEVELKELVYLESTYDRLYRQAVEELTPDKKKEQLALIQVSSTCLEQLNQFINKSEWLYSITSRYDDSGDYKYYDGMASWYNAQIRTTAKVLDNVSKLAKEENNMQNEFIQFMNHEWNENKLIHVKVMENAKVVYMFFEKE